MKKLEKKEIKKISKAFDLSSKRTKIAVIKIFNEKIKSSTKICYLSAEKISKLNNKKSEANATYLDFTGFFGGRTVLILPKKASEQIANQFLKDFPVQTKKLQKSALLEYANIVVGAFLSELSNYCQVSLLETVPKFKTGNHKQLFSVICKGKKEDLSLLLEIEFSFKNNHKFYFFVLLDNDCSLKLAKSLEYVK